MSYKSTHPIVCFGELLWDILPGGKHPGGAPYNVCYHLNQLGLPAIMITAIGDDADGYALLKELRQQEMSADYLQKSALPTSTVIGELSADNEMVYTITPNVAWDDIHLTEENQRLVENAPYFIFGSLAARSNTTKQTLLQLLRLAHTKVFDVNLRAPHYNKPLISELLSHTNILKINERELDQLSTWFASPGSTEKNLQRISTLFSIEEIIVTKGAGGSIVFKENNLWYQDSEVVAVADTVGSGDAFLAGYLLAREKGLDKIRQSQMANRLAGWVTQSYGGCPPYTSAIRNALNQIQS